MKWVGGACGYTCIFFFLRRKGSVSLCFEAVLLRGRGAARSADLGTSSKESYWDYNRGWPKRRKVPCCSLVRRGWVSPKPLAETALKRLTFWNCGLFFFLFCFTYINWKMRQFYCASWWWTGSWLIFQHQYIFSLKCFFLWNMVLFSTSFFFFFFVYYYY